MGIRRAIANWLLGETKASATAPLIAIGKLGAAQWTPRKYDKLAKESYEKNVVAFKAINEIITAMEQMPWEVMQQDDKGDLKDAPMSPLAKLMRRPNPRQSGSVLWGTWAGFYLISGNSYIEAVSTTPTRPPLELYTLRPDRMTVIAGNDGPAGYQYSVNGDTKKWIGSDAGLIRHIKTFHPTNDWYGMSPVEAAAFDIDIHNATLEWNKALLDNGAAPSGALIYEPKRDSSPDYLPEEQFVRLKQELEENYAGSKNAGKPFLLEGGLKWESMSFSPKDMDYIGSKNTTARDICMAFGVPPQLLGIPGDNTYSNMAEARMALWEQTVLPLAYKLRDELNAWLAPMFGDEFVIAVDEDDIMALAPRRAEQWAKLESTSFLTLNEKREAVGYEHVDGGDQVLQPANLVPAGTVLMDTGPSSDGATSTDRGQEGE